ncbi:MAG: hypothetical protein WC942_10055, partial [Clostridia bacterium]
MNLLSIAKQIQNNWEKEYQNNDFFFYVPVPKTETIQNTPELINNVSINNFNKIIDNSYDWILSQSYTNTQDIDWEYKKITNKEQLIKIYNIYTDIITNPIKYSLVGFDTDVDGNLQMLYEDSPINDLIKDKFNTRVNNILLIVNNFEKYIPIINGQYMDLNGAFYTPTSVEQIYKLTNPDYQTTYPEENPRNIFHRPEMWELEDVLREYPVFAKYPPILDAIYNLKSARDFHGLANDILLFILNHESEISQTTKADWDIIRYAPYHQMMDEIEFSDISGGTLKNLLHALNVYDNSRDVFYTIASYDYLKNHFDKRIVIIAVESQNKQLLQEANDNKNWTVLNKYKKQILREAAEVAIKKATVTHPEIFENIHEKEPMVKALNVDFKDYQFKVLEKGDPLHLLIGSLTNCCQRIGGAGQSAAIDSFINPHAGVLVLIKNNDILSQSYFHYIDTRSYFNTNVGYILDNVEWNEEAVKHYNIDLNEAYARLALWAKTNLKITIFECGTLFNKLNKNKFSNNTSLYTDPRTFYTEETYSDWSPTESINLLKYNPDILQSKEENPETDKIKPLIGVPYTENIGKIKSPKFHGRLQQLYKSKRKDNKYQKTIRREQENILSQFGIQNIDRILSIPYVKNITKIIADKKLNKKDFSHEMVELKNYLINKQLLQVAAQWYADVFYKTASISELINPSDKEMSEIINIEKIFDKRYGEGWSSEKEDVYDDLQQQNPVALTIKDTDGPILGYIYGYQASINDIADAEEELDYDIDLSTIKQIAQNGKLFYISNMAIPNKGKVQIFKLLSQFKHIVKNKGYEFFITEALSDSARLIFNEDGGIKNSRLHMLGIDIISY